MAQQRIKSLSLREVEHIAFTLAREHLSFDEPIPEFSTRIPGIAESCIFQPFQKLYGKSMYPTFVLKVSTLFYLMIKNHPFVNGNKRIAVTTLMVFLHKNGKWLEVDPKEFYNFTVWIASSPAQLKEQVVPAIEKFIQMHLVEAGATF